MGAIKKFYKLLKRIAFYTSYEGRELRRIKNIPRYENGNTKIFGFDFTFVDSASFAYQYHEIFTKKTYNFKTPNAQPYIIDCGSNVGTSILFFKKKFPHAKILAFEPDKIVFSALKKNMANLNLRGITLINKGLWNQEGKIFFQEESADGGSILDKNDEVPTDKKITEIETTSLRPYLNAEVDFLKIDIEGAESIVLEDCDGLLKNVQRIFIEYHSAINKKQQLDSILNILTKNGFRYYIESTIICNSEPFIIRNTSNNYDDLLSIYAYR